MKPNPKEKYLQHLIQVIDARCADTKKHIDGNRSWLSNNRNLANFSLLLKEMIFTLGVEHAEGAHFTDLNGNDYLDMTMGFGVHLFGHKAEFLEKAMQHQLKKGIALGPLYIEAAEVAKLIHEITGVERCTFYNTGTEAVMVAMRIARAATRKNKIVIFEGCYHGTHDSLLAMKTDPETNTALTSVPGVLQSALDNTIILKYGEAASISFIQDHANDIAGVLVEPVMSRHPEMARPEFLQQLRAVCTGGKIALIFDEIITGFRISDGGAAKYFGIEPDIVTYGKILGGGIPIGVVAGKSIYLDTIDGGQWKFGDDSAPQTKTTFTAGTFNHHPLAMAAAKATLQFIKNDKGNLQQELNEKTTHLCNELNAFFEKEGFSISMVSFGSLFRFKLTGMQRLIFYSLLKEGIYIWEGRNCFLSSAHTYQDIAFFIRKVKKCCFELAAAAVLTGRKPMPSSKCTQLIQSAISVQAILDTAELDLTARYLFNTIPRLRSVPCCVRFETLSTEKEDVDLPQVGQHEGLILSVYQTATKTIIHFSADRDICDGWSVILFFKALACCYTHIQKKQPLPDIDYPAKESIQGFPLYQTQQEIKKSFAAKTLHATIQLEEIPAPMRTKLFAFMLYSFYRSLQQGTAVNDTTIGIPMAGQLLTRNLKVFDNCTVYIPYTFRAGEQEADMETSIDQLEYWLKKIKFSFNQYSTQTQAEIIFNLDNLDFNLAFDDLPARLLPTEDNLTRHKIVCNISKLHKSLLISLKYSADAMSDHEANELLHRFTCNMQTEKKHEHL